MKTTGLNQTEKNKKNIAFESFSTTKRLQWDKYRRYGMFVS
ncbi:MAG: hypothetical protein PHW92_01240 [Lutibacter sp.]|nr:hypothetical protein [Lutibacter sp.]